MFWRLMRAIIGGAGLPLYLAAWVLIPEEGSDIAIGDGLLHQEARSRAAHVTLVEVDPVDDAFDRLIHRRVGEDDVRGLSTELERQAFVAAGETACDDLADLGGSGEGDLVDVGMIDQRGAR